MIQLGERYCEIFLCIIILYYIILYYIILYSIVYEMSWENAQHETLILTKNGKILLGNFINFCKESMLS